MNAELLLSIHFFFLGGGAMGAKNLDIFHSSIVLNSWTFMPPKFPFELLNKAKNISVVLLCSPIKMRQAVKMFKSYNRTHKRTNGETNWDYYFKILRKYFCFYKNLKSRFIPLFDACFFFIKTYVVMATFKLFILEKSKIFIFQL